MVAIAQTYPTYRHIVKEFVDEHLEIKDEPLLLALYYAPEREPEDVFLLEVTENFASGRIDQDRELFEAAFSSKSGLRIPEGTWLHITMTNPTELRAALKEKWKLAEEIRRVIHQGRYEVIFCAPGEGDVLLKEMCSEK